MYLPDEVIKVKIAFAIAHCDPLYWEITYKDFITGSMSERIQEAFWAEVEMSAGLAELILAPEAGPVFGSYIGLHGIGNLASGAGNYMDIFTPEVNRDWNVTRQAYETIFSLGDTDNAWMGTAAFYFIDFSIGIYGLLRPVPKFGYEGVPRNVPTEPAFKQTLAGNIQYQLIKDLPANVVKELGITVNNIEGYKGILIITHDASQAGFSYTGSYEITKEKLESLIKDTIDNLD